MQRFKVLYYLTPSGSNPVKIFIDSLGDKQKAKIFRIFQNFQDYGIEAIKHHTKKISNTPLWEIRILGKDSIRIVYIHPDKTKLIVLHGFAKKSQKTPGKELNIAIQRFTDWRSNN